MKVLHIQTSMTPAGNAAFRLHVAMRKAGIESSVLTLLPTIKRNHVANLGFRPISVLSKFVNKIYMGNIMRSKLEDSYFFSPLPMFTFNDVLPYAREVDVIYLHWIAANFFSVRDIELLGRLNKPVIFFMHDMWTMTGGCHHSFSCDGYTDGCKHCRMFPTKYTIAEKENKKKTNLFHQYHNFHFVSPSMWLAACAKNSTILKDKPIYSIPNIVDENIFKPIEKNVARDILNLPKDKYIIAFGNQAGTGNQFKGWNYLRDAINKLDLTDIQLLVYGSDFNQKIVDELKYPIQFLGSINDEYVLSLICNAANLFVSPSLAESFGLTFLENILCGTPVIGFNCTAVPEIVKSGVNGYLAKYKDADDLAHGIREVYNKMSIAKGREDYSSSEIINQHLSLINKVITL